MNHIPPPASQENFHFTLSWPFIHGSIQFSDLHSLTNLTPNSTQRPIHASSKIKSTPHSNFINFFQDLETSKQALASLESVDRAAGQRSLVNERVEGVW